MRAFLVRHGEATSGTETPGRPLSVGGREDVEKVARAVARLGSGPSVILHSTKLRAAETAGLLADRLAPRDGVIEVGEIHGARHPAQIGFPADLSIEAFDGAQGRPSRIKPNMLPLGLTMNFSPVLVTQTVAKRP